MHHCAYIRMTSANAQAMTLPLLDSHIVTDKDKRALSFAEILL